MSFPRLARAAAVISVLTLGGGAAAALASAPRAHAHAPAARAAKCSRSHGKLSPRLLSPCNHASLPASKAVTFTAKDRNPLARKYPPFLDVTSAPPHHGVLKPDTSGKGVFTQMKPVPGHRGRFSATPTLFTFPGYWLVTPGRYYVQVQQVDCSKRGCHRNSPVETITVQ